MSLEAIWKKDWQETPRAGYFDSDAAIAGGLAMFTQNNFSIAPSS